MTDNKNKTNSIAELQNLIDYFPWINLTDNLKDSDWKNNFIDKINKFLENIYLETRLEYFKDAFSLKTKQYEPIKTFINYGYVPPDQQRLKKYLLLNKFQFTEQGILSFCLDIEDVLKEFNYFALEHFFLRLEKNNLKIRYDDNSLIFTEDNTYHGVLSYKRIRSILQEMTNKPKVLLIPISRKDEAIVNLINCDLDLTLVFLEELDLISNTTCYFYYPELNLFNLTIKHYNFLIDIDNHFDKDLIFNLNFEYMIDPPFYKNAIYKLILDDD